MSSFPDVNVNQILQMWEKLHLVISLHFDFDFQPVNGQCNSSKINNNNNNNDKLYSYSTFQKQVLFLCFTKQLLHTRITVYLE